MLCFRFTSIPSTLHSQCIFRTDAFFWALCSSPHVEIDQITYLPSRNLLSLLTSPMFFFSSSLIYYFIAELGAKLTSIVSGPGYNGSRKAFHTQSSNPAIDLQEQYEDLAAQQMDLQAVMEKTKQDLREDIDQRYIEHLHLFNSLKNPFDESYSQSQSKDRVLSSTVKNNVLQLGQGILGPDTYCDNSNHGHKLGFLDLL